MLVPLALTRTPTPLDQLQASMLDSVTKKAMQRLADEKDYEGEWCSDQGRCSIELPGTACQLCLLRRISVLTAANH